MSERTTAILLIAVVALGAMTGVAAADGHLEVAVDEDADGTSTVTVTDNGTAVENATVDASVVDAENESYAGAGEYETDANGTVDLEAPEEDVTVEVAAAAGNDTAATTVDLEAPDGLELDVDDTDGEPVVTVANDDDPVGNASVNVTAADENATYAGEGEYETDENGTVGLPAAEEDVTVEVAAEYGNESVSETAEFEAPDGLELDVDDTDEEPTVAVTDDDEPLGNATVDVALADDADENASYAGTGEYETDENGTVDLPAAEEDVSVDVTASDDDRSASTTVELTADGEEEGAAEGTPFGQLMRDFIEDISDREGGIGAAVSDFATENNPGNAPDHAGGPGDADGNETDENESAPGNAPDHAGPDSDNESGEGGPPAHAGPGGDDADEEDDADEGDAEEDDAGESESEEDEEDEEDDDEDDEDDGESGPPDHAGGPGGN